MVDDELVQAAIQARDANRDMLMGKANVTGTDIGFRYVGGESTPTVAIRVFVSQKGDVADADRIPPDIDGIPTDVIETSPVQPQLDLSDKRDPLVGGISIGPEHAIDDEGNWGIGTLGAIMQGADGTLYGLTNYHVLAKEGAKLKKGDVVTQPAPGDHGPIDLVIRNFHRVGKVTDALLWSLNEEDQTHTLFSTDAALFSLDRKVRSAVAEIGPITGSGPPRLGAKIVKCGRRTGVTYGLVDGVNGERLLDENWFYWKGFGSGWVRPCVRVKSDKKRGTTQFTDEGDSGAVYVDEDTRTVIGLHIGFSGGNDGTFSLGSPILDVERHFGVSVFVDKPAPPFDLHSHPWQPVQGSTGDEWASNLVGVPGLKLEVGAYNPHTGWVTSQWDKSKGHTIEIRGYYNSYARTLYACVAGPGAADGLINWRGSATSGGKLSLDVRGWNGTSFDGQQAQKIDGFRWYRVEASHATTDHNERGFTGYGMTHIYTPKENQPFRLWVGRAG